MAAQIFDFPGESVRPAGQPLIFSINDTVSAPGRYVVVVKITSQVTGGTPIELGKFYLTPNAQGVAFFDLSPLAVASMSYPTKKGTTVVHKVDDIEYMDQLGIARFIVEVGSYNTTTGNEAPNQDSEQIFITNGTEQIADGLHPSFTDYLWTNTPGFLSERTLGGFEENAIVLRSDEERTMTMIAAEDIGDDFPATQTPRIQYGFISKSSGTTYVYKNLPSFTTYAQRRLMHIPYGWANISAFSPFTLDQMRLLQVRLTGLDSSTGFNYPYSLFLAKFDDSRGCRNTATQVAWINTRGGWEYLRFDSRAPKQISVEGKTYRKTIGTYGKATFSFDPAGAQYDTFAKTGKEQYTLQENFFHANERDLLDSLMKSRLVQIRRMDETVWKPVTVLTNSLTIQPAGSQFYNVSLQVEIAQDIRC